MPSSTKGTDLYLCVGFAFGFIGLIMGQIWWVMGGTLIFMMPFLGEEADKHTKHTDEGFPID